MTQCPYTNTNLASPDTYTQGVPFAEFARLRSEQPISWQVDPDNGVGYWAITRREHLDFISKAPEIFSSAERTCFYFERDDAQIAMMRNLLINMDPPDHVKYRRIVRNAFTPKAVDSYEQRFRDIAREIIDRILPKGRCEFVSEVAAELPLIAICELMGIPLEDRHQFFEWTNKMIGADDPDLAVSREEAGMAHFNVFQYGRRLAELHRESPRSNIVGTLLDGTVQEEHLTDIEFCNFFLLLVVAGNETTRTVTTHGMRLLLENPEQYRRLQQNPELVETAVEEFLRYHPAVIQFRRTAMQDIELDGVQMKKGDKVVMFYPSVNRDETVFPDADTFDIDRDLRDGIKNEHRAFGIGEHFCLGSHLARLELKVIFEEIVRRVNEPRLDGELKWMRSNLISGVKSMPVTFRASV
jgi:cholest-4-en-3-one 26-monooxygenase